MRTTLCPPENRLRDFLHGKLSADESELLEVHLSNCLDCEETATILDSESDTLAEFLFESSDDEPKSNTQQDFESAKRLFEARKDDQQNPLSAGPQDNIGSYQLLDRLGYGGMGAVYLAKHRELDREVAIKLLPNLSNSDADTISRFRREMRVIGRLRHSAIVHATDAGSVDGRHYLVMEVIEGLDLGRIVSINGPLAIGDACEVVRQAAVGLEYAHEQSVVHRDIKPSNLMLDKTGQVKILDFGLAQLQVDDSETSELTSVGQIMGTWEYMAPEQARRTTELDHRADVYALGATLFKLLTGLPPIEHIPRHSPLDKLRAFANQGPRRIDELRADLSDDLVLTIERMLDAAPDNRPQTASEVARLLEAHGRTHDLTALLETSNRELRAPTPRNAQAGKRDFASKSQKRSRVSWWNWTASAVSLCMLVAGILFVLETSKGLLVVESKEADVTVEIRSLDRSGWTRELRVDSTNESTRLRDGKYEIRLSAGSNAFTVESDTIVIRRGEIEVARVTRRADGDLNSRPSGPTTKSSDEIQIGDTLAILVPPIIPLHSNPKLPAPTIPILRTTHGWPVQGLPFRVDSDGNIQLPLRGALPVVGLRPQEVSERIRKEYVESKFLSEDEQRKVAVHVTVVSRAGENGNVADTPHPTDAATGKPKRVMRNRVARGDTLAIHLNGIIPMHSDPRGPVPEIPILQTDRGLQVQGLPFRVDSDGNIHLPLRGKVNILDLTPQEVGAKIRQEYLNAQILYEDQQRKVVVNVNFVSRAEAPNTIAETAASETTASETTKASTAEQEITYGREYRKRLARNYFGNSKVVRDLRTLAVSLDRPDITIVDAAIERSHLQTLVKSKSLKSLKIVDCTISEDALSELANIENLEKISFPYCENVEEFWLEAIANCTKLETIILSGTNIQDHWLQHLRKAKGLKYLSLSDTSTGDSGIAILEDLPSIVSLSLTNVRITDAGLKSLSGLQKLHSLFFTSPNVKGDGFQHLAGLPNLQELSITGDYVTDEWLAGLATLPNISWLQMTRSSVTSDGLRHLLGWKSLRTFYCNRNTKLRSDAIEVLSSMYWLKKLTIFQSGLNDAEVAELKERLPDVHIN